MLNDGWQTEFEEHVDILAGSGRAVSELRETRRKLEREARRSSASKDEVGPMRVLLSTNFLTDCIDFLIADPNGYERLHIVTGPITAEGVRVLSEMEKVPFSMQSAGGVAADPEATHRLMMKLDAKGFRPHGSFHNHPMKGASGTAPSGTDMDNQARFEKQGWDTVMGIASCDGQFFRLFTTHRDMEPMVCGNGASIISQSRREIILKLER